MNWKKGNMSNARIVQNRAYSGPQDLQTMIDLVKERPPARLTDFPGILDLQEMLAVPEIQAHTRLWFSAAGPLVCFAILDMDPDSGNLSFEVSPGWLGKGLEKELVAWVEDHIRQTDPPVNRAFQLETSAPSADPDRIALLQELGFNRLEVGALHMERSLAEPIPQPHLPQGFIIRPLRGEAEAEAWVRLHRAAHGTELMTTEYKLGMMQTPYYDPAMDLVAVAPDGSLAAYCVCFISVEENALTGQSLGYTDPIATHPDFQRRGLSKALMLSGLALLKDRSMQTACLGTSSDNTAMQRTAESAGFHITGKTFRFSKTIHHEE
jgi:mycothiol synthase